MFNTPNELILKDKEIIIINSFGVLNNFFKYAKSVFIGKSILRNLKNDGGQSPIDAVKLGCKIYHGPYVYNFKEIYDILEKYNISKVVKNSAALSEFLIKDFDNYENKNVEFPDLIKKLGQRTLTDTMTRINNFLINEIK